VDWATLRDAAIALAPGFIALKVFYLFGTQRPRSQWEWVIWSVIASVPIQYVSDEYLTDWATAALPFDDEVAIAVVRIAVALAVGVALSLAWRYIGGTKLGWLQRRQRDVTDSAFDLVIEDAVRNQRVVEIWPAGDAEPRYRGWIHTFARESAQAVPWMFISRVEERTGGAWQRVPGTHGYLFHRDNVQRLRVYQTSEEWAAERAETEAQQPNKPPQG
jgi:hypothetical protein